MLILLNQYLDVVPLATICPFYMLINVNPYFLQMTAIEQSLKLDKSI